MKLSTLACSSLHAPLPLLVLAPALASPFVAAMVRLWVPCRSRRQLLGGLDESCAWPRAEVCGRAVGRAVVNHTLLLSLFRTGLERLQETGTASGRSGQDGAE